MVRVKGWKSVGQTAWWNDKNVRRWRLKAKNETRVINLKYGSTEWNVDGHWFAKTVIVYWFDTMKGINNVRLLRYRNFSRYCVFDVCFRKYREMGYVSSKHEIPDWTWVCFVLKFVICNQRSLSIDVVHTYVSYVNSTIYNLYDEFVDVSLSNWKFEVFRKRSWATPKLIVCAHNIP